MNLIIEMTDNIGLDYYYVTVYCKADYLIIETPERLLKELNRQLPVAELEGVHWQEHGNIRRLVFSHKGEHYGIVDVGNGFTTAVAATILKKTLV